jgi:hypothetical protein
MAMMTSKIAVTNKLSNDKNGEGFVFLTSSLSRNDNRPTI